MTTQLRNGNRWTVNEILSLQREYELLGWSLDQIAHRHKRSVNAIMFKLDNEGFANYNTLYSNYHGTNTETSNNIDSNESLNFKSINDNDDEHEDPYDEDYVPNHEDEDEDEDEDEEDYDEFADLSERVYGLENSVNEIKDMLKMLTASLNYQQNVSHKL